MYFGMYHGAESDLLLIIQLKGDFTDPELLSEYHFETFILNSNTMKKIIITSLTFFIFFCAYAQTIIETEIRKLENAQREAFLKKDTVTLYQLFSSGFVVNAPTNKVTTLQDLKVLIRNGNVDMEAFERVTEKITFTNNIAIAMGNETLRPTGKMPNAGKTVKRRYTNIWMKNKKSWQLVARQSTIISVE